jgi:hypothetical protein
LKASVIIENDAARSDLILRSLIAQLLKKHSAIHRGYSLMHVVPQTGAELAAARNCRDALASDTWAAYNALNGTQYQSFDDFDASDQHAYDAALLQWKTREIEVQTRSGDWYLLGIRPYRTLENVVEGAVVTFTLVTEL